MFFKRKGVALVVVVILFLSIVVVAAFSLQVWYLKFGDDWRANLGIEGDYGDLEILEMKYFNETVSLLGVRNSGEVSQFIGKIEVDDSECSVSDSVLERGVNDVYLSCVFSVGEAYEVVIYSDFGIFSKIVSVY